MHPICRGAATIIQVALKSTESGWSLDLLANFTFLSLMDKETILKGYSDSSSIWDVSPSGSNINWSPLRVLKLTFLHLL